MGERELRIDEEQPRGTVITAAIVGLLWSAVVAWAASIFLRNGGYLVNVIVFVILFSIPQLRFLEPLYLKKRLIVSSAGVTRLLMACGLLVRRSTWARQDVLGFDAGRVSRGHGHRVYQTEYLSFHLTHGHMLFTLVDGRRENMSDEQSHLEEYAQECASILDVPHRLITST